MSEQRFTSVWDAIEDTPQQAASMRVRSELMMALQKWLKPEGLTQETAAGLFGVGLRQAKFSNISPLLAQPAKPHYCRFARDNAQVDNHLTPYFL